MLHKLCFSVSWTFINIPVSSLYLRESILLTYVHEKINDVDNNYKRWIN